MDEKVFYAHSNNGLEAEWQTLRQHLQGTADLTVTLGADSGVEQYACIAALFHDIGKYSSPFQKRLQGSSQRVDHSTAGAIEIKRIMAGNQSQKIISELLAYCIAGHHGGLMNYGSPVDLRSDNTLMGRLKKAIPDFSDYATDMPLTGHFYPEKLSIIPTTQSASFSLSFFTRMIYSLLTDADFQDTETFMNQGRKPRGDFASLDELLHALRLYLEALPKTDTPVVRQRMETLNECLAEAKNSPGFFTLTVPTGGGKTLSSLAFALTHAVVNRLRRIIYVIPYTTIIEQNAAVFKECLGKENVLEHHAGFDWENAFKSEINESADDLTNRAVEKLKLSSENWDIPLVVTTNVQFFESLFANRSSRCRKIHNLAKSVIIFDEAQMLPRNFLDPCMKAVNELAVNYGATALFCTATQPSLSRFFPATTRFKEISSDPKGLYDRYRRVRVIVAGKLNDAEVTRRLNNYEHEQALCIVNTRRHAQVLFNALLPENRFHLSTWMCPLHRQNTLSAVRKCLEGENPCRVVSTQLMEAGVDLDFPVGFRSLAGLDSIIQAAGRINREGKRKTGDLFVFEPDTPSIKQLPAVIAQTAAVTKTILAKFPEDPICLDAIRSYFDTLYDLQGTYAFDVHRIMDCFEKGIPGNIAFDFETAARNFRLIEQNTNSLVIPFDDKFYGLLADDTLLVKPYILIRKLQKYSINVYEKDLDNLQRKGAIRFINDEIPVLSNMQFYSMDTGLILPDEMDGEAIIC